MGEGDEGKQRRDISRTPQTVADTVSWSVNTLGVHIQFLGLSLVGPPGIAVSGSNGTA